MNILYNTCWFPRQHGKIHIDNLYAQKHSLCRIDFHEQTVEFGIGIELEHVSCPRLVFNVLTRKFLYGTSDSVVCLYTNVGRFTQVTVHQIGRFFDSLKDVYLCSMNNKGLLALAQLILPSEILSNFEVVHVEKGSSLIRIDLDESVKA